MGMRLGVVAAVVLLLAGCNQGSVAGAGIDGARIANADAAPGEWLTHGRTYSEQRYSPLDDINRDTVKRLNLAWRFDLPEDRGIEATPLVADGVMYTSSSWSVVRAFNARTGELIWTGGDTHLYLNHAELVEEQLGREPGGEPTLELVRKPDSIFGYRIEDFEVRDYAPQARLSAPVAV